MQFEFSKMSSELVSVLIPRTVDNRFLLTNLEGRGLWLPTCTREGEESLRGSAVKLGEQVHPSWTRE